MPTMTVEQGECQIYPSKQEQMCVRIRVLVMQLRPGENTDGEWVAETNPLRAIELKCGQQGLDRLLRGIDSSTSPPTPRQRKAEIEPGIAS